MPLSREEAIEFYNRLGARQDRQAFYEDAATGRLIAESGFDTSQSVLEFGCGTGRFAELLLRNYLPEDCHYVGVDSSSTMVSLARKRLKPWASRSEIHLTDGSPRILTPTSAYDRFVSNYVVDLMTEQDIHMVLAEAQRVLGLTNKLCLVSLSHGTTVFSQLVTVIWQHVHNLNAKWVGGCRPLNLLEFLKPEIWQVEHHGRVTRWGISSQVVVASLLPATRAVRSQEKNGDSRPFHKK